MGLRPANAKKYDSQTVQRGTENNPLAIKLVGSEQSEEEKQKQAAESTIKAASDKRMLEIAEQQLVLAGNQTDYTGRLVWIGWFQACVFLLQLGAFACQANWMRHTVREMDVGTKATVKAAGAAKKSADIAEQSLILIERPYLFITDVIGFTKRPITAQGFFTPQEIVVPYVGYTVINHGKTPAFIEGIWADISGPHDYSPAYPIYEGKVRSVLNKPILAPGESESGVKENAPATVIFKPHEFRKWLIPDIPKDYFVYFRIVVKYRGSFSTNHESGFCWIYSGDCFIPFGGAEYNYVK